MTISIYATSFDAANAANLAKFWAATLGRDLNPGASPESASIAAANGDQPILFHGVPETKIVKNRLHLDLVTADFESELARLVRLGATELATFPAWTTLADPEGNEFDLIRAADKHDDKLAFGGALMSANEQPEYWPSASERARDQVARYEASDGADGGELDGRPVVILTTRGASSGALRKTPIMRVVDGESYVAIASYAGNPRNPAWYHNLTAHPDAEVRDGAQRIPVRARQVSGSDKTRLWAIADADNPAYARYRATSGREIPVLLLEPTS